MISKVQNFGIVGMLATAQPRVGRDQQAKGPLTGPHVRLPESMAKKQPLAPFAPPSHWHSTTGKFGTCLGGSMQAGWANTQALTDEGHRMRMTFRLSLPLPTTLGSQP